MKETVLNILSWLDKCFCDCYMHDLENVYVNVTCMISKMFMYTHAYNMKDSLEYIELVKCLSD
jgi:hypothetical protein